MIAYFVFVAFFFDTTGSSFTGSSMLLSLLAGKDIFLEAFNCWCGGGKQKKKCSEGNEMGVRRMGG